MTIVMAKLLLKDLKGACAEQRTLFKQHFGKGGEVTLTKVLSVASDFNWNWAARHLLSAPALAEYGKAIAPARAEYGKVCATAWAEYGKVCATALAEYDKVCASTWFICWEADHVSSLSR